MNRLTGTLTPSRLRCNALTDPLAISHSTPRLSWIVRSDERGQSQRAYQILAASSPHLLEEGRADLWDSQMVASAETITVEYEGAPVGTGERCWWKVRVWDNAMSPSDWSTPAVFGTGLQPSEWMADWIGFDQTRDLQLPPAPFDGAEWIWLAGEAADGSVGVFVGTLELPEDITIVHSEVAISVSGRYQFYWKGEQFAMSDEDPEPWKRPYIRHMNERLHPGTNHFLIKAEQAGDLPPAVLFKVSVRGNDGRVFSMVSDETWQVTPELAEQWHLGEGAENWPRCAVVAHYGDAPWGLINGIDNFLPPPAYLRGTFSVTKPVRCATLFATAFGWYDLHLNGQRVNDSFFDPGWTDYHQRLYYRAYDVTEGLCEGQNGLGAVLADGWFRGYIGWCHQRDVYGKKTRFRGQLHLEYEDGSSEIIGTGSDWKASLGPIKEADILMGEVYDARAELTGWERPGFDDSSWQSVDLGAELTPQIQPHPAPPVVALEAERFSPTSTTEPQPGLYIFDLGQNFAGIVRLKLSGTTSGQSIRLRFGERLNADGTLYTVNLRTARATDTYICRGDGEEIWSPRFTFHGFQYVEVTGLTAAPAPETITGLPLSTDTPRAGTFECSDVLASRLASNIYWGQRSNFIEIPTDCPQRDERLGWCDGTWTFIGAAALRTDVQGFYTKWLVDLDDAQMPDGLFPWLAPLVVTVPEVSGPMWAGSSSAWLDAGVICPWFVYEIYGDKRQLEEHYPAMLRQIEWYRTSCFPNLLPRPGYKCLGDWLNYNAPIPEDVFRTAFFAYSTGLLARSAEVLGKTEDAVRYGHLHRAIKAAFCRAYIQPDGRILGDSQSGYAFSIAFDLLDETQMAKAGEHLVANIRDHHWLPTTGLEGTLPLMLSLARIGRNDVAYRLLHNEEFPSWNFSIKNGATTIWERWDSWTPEKGFGDANMNSFNHFSLGAIYQWMVENIGGIKRDGTAYERITIAPAPGGKLTSAHVSHDSIRGLIETRWQLNGNSLDLTVQIPANTTATLILPASDPDSITEGGRPLSQVSELEFERQDEGHVVLNALSGCYQFKIQNPTIACDPSTTGDQSPLTALNLCL